MWRAHQGFHGAATRKHDHPGRLLQSAIGVEAEFLGEPPSAVDGYGLGFYHGGEVLHRKRPMFEATHLTWPAIFEGVAASITLAHVREGTVGEARADNTHPFRMRQWLFAHHGSLEGFEAMRENILKDLPDFLQRNIRGDTDSEHIFHVVLSFLHDAGQIDVQDATDRAVIGALQSTIALLDRHANEVGAPCGQLNLTLTNGRALFLVRRGAPFHFIVRDRLPDDVEGPDGRSVGPVRYLVALSHKLETPPLGYLEIPEGQIARIDRELGIAYFPVG